MARKNELARELPGAILGLFLFGIFVAISWFLGEIGVFALGWGGIVEGLLVGGAFGFMYAALNRKRRYDAVMVLMLAGYGVGAYLVEAVYPNGQFVVNLATSTSGAAFIVWILMAVFLLILLIAPFVYAKRTNLR